MMAEKNIPLVTTLSVSLGLADMKGLPDYMTKKAKALGDASKHSLHLHINMAFELHLEQIIPTHQIHRFMKSEKNFTA